MEKHIMDTFTSSQEIGDVILFSDGIQYKITRKEPINDQFSNYYGVEIGNSKKDPLLALQILGHFQDMRGPAYNTQEYKVLKNFIIKALNKNKGKL